MSVNNILKCYSQADSQTIQAGLDWYPNAASFAKSLCQDFERAAGVIAALSPRQSWNVNKRAAAKLFTAIDRGDDFPLIPGIWANVYKAWDIANGANPISILGQSRRNFKVYRFFKNILGDTDGVTVDSWAAKVAIPNLTTPYIRGTLYLGIEKDYQKAAKKLGLAPRDLQAICWIQIRGRA